MKKKLIHIFSLLTVLGLMACNSISYEIDSDRKIYGYVLDSLSHFKELRVDITPEKLMRYYFLRDMFNKGDSTYFKELNKDLSKPNKRDTLNFKCDTCVYVAYLQYNTSIMFANNYLRKSDFTLKNNIVWPSDTLKIKNLPFKEYLSGTIKYICLTKRRSRNIDCSLGQHPMNKKNELLFSDYGNYFIGDFTLSGILYSQDKKYAFVLVAYNMVTSFEFYFHKKNGNWVLENIKKNSLNF